LPLPATVGDIEMSLPLSAAVFCSWLTPSLYGLSLPLPATVCDTEMREKIRIKIIHVNLHFLLYIPFIPIIFFNRYTPL